MREEKHGHPQLDISISRKIAQEQKRKIRIQEEGAA
jgi:hypothetical protein